MFGISNKNLFIAYTLQVVHYILWVVCGIALVICAIYEPWYISILLLTLMSSPFVVKDYCYLQILENKYREKAGLRALNAFYEELLGDTNPNKFTEDDLNTLRVLNKRLQELHRQMDKLRES